MSTTCSQVSWVSFWGLICAVQLCCMLLFSFNLIESSHSDQELLRSGLHLNDATEQASEGSSVNLKEATSVSLRADRRDLIGTSEYHLGWQDEMQVASFETVKAGDMGGGLAKALDCAKVWEETTYEHFPRITKWVAGQGREMKKGIWFKPGLGNRDPQKC